MGEKETMTAEALAGKTSANDDWNPPAGRVFPETNNLADDGSPEAAEREIIKSKSNITNNRDDAGEAGRLNALPPGEPTTSTIADTDGDGSPGAAGARVTKTRSNIQNNREASAGPGDGDAPPGGEPAEAVNLNPSKSNRVANPDPGDDAGPAEAALNTSHSNIKNLREAAVPPGGEPPEATNLNSSRSN